MEWLNTIFAGIVAAVALASAVVAGVWAAALFVCRKLDERFARIEAQQQERFKMINKRMDAQDAQHKQLQSTLNDLLFERTRRD